MKARLVVRKRFPQSHCIRTYESIVSIPRVATGWMITDGVHDFGKGKTKTEAWENARVCIEKNEIDETRELTKEEAITYLREGRTLTHVYFMDNEWMYMEDGELVFED